MITNKLHVYYKRFALSFIFYIVESIITAFLLSYYNYLAKPTIEFSNFEIISRFTFAIYLFRIVTLQILFEISVIYVVIHYGKWQNFWVVWLGVIGSVLIWDATISLLLTGSLVEGIKFLKAPFAGYGIPIFLGTLFSWWLCYKKLGLNI